MKALQAGLVGPRQFELFEEDLTPDSDEVLIEIAACGICSSEIPMYLGDWPPELHPEALGGGSMPIPYKPPIILGHEPSGTIVQVGAEVTRFTEGIKVTGAFNNGFATHALAKEENLIEVPSGVKLEHALGEPLFCITNIARAAAPKFGDNVAVVGCGQMGLLIIAALKNAGLGSLIAVDRIQERLDLALSIGATHAINVSPIDRVMSMTDGGCDVVVEMTGGPSGLELSADLLRVGQGKLIMAGYHHSPGRYNLRNFAAKSLVAHSAHPHYSPNQFGDYKRAMAALSSGTFPMDMIVTHRFHLDQVADGFEALLSNQEGFLKGIVVPKS